MPSHDETDAAHKGITVEEAARLLGLSAPFVVRLIRQGNLLALGSGAIRAEDLAAYKRLLAVNSPACATLRESTKNSA